MFRRWLDQYAAIMSGFSAGFALFTLIAVIATR